MSKRTRLEAWKEMCACGSQKNDGNYTTCRCGAAKHMKLVCLLCDADLMFRRGHPPFWGCSNFAPGSGGGCQYTQTVHQEDIQAADPTITTPARQGGPTVITPPEASAGAANTSSQTSPQNLFHNNPTFQFKDTFIGENWAEILEGTNTQGLKYSHIAPHTYRYEYYDGPPTKDIPISSDNNKPVVLDLFAGAGGMSLGLKRAGFDTKYAVDKDMVSANTLQCNQKGTVMFTMDVREFLKGVKEKRASYPTSAAHIHSSSPCQDFSVAKKSSLAGTARNELFSLIIEAVELLNPSTISIENVKGIFNDGNKKYLQQVVAQLLKMGYQVHVSLVNAIDFGVPQHRERMILLAAKKGFPLPQDPTTVVKRQPIRTVEEALGDLEAIEPVDEGVPIALDGRVIYDHIEWKPRSFPGESPNNLINIGIAQTVCRRNIIRHYNADRDITIRERARLQAFPDSYYFCGTPEQQGDQIGNAVPIDLARAIGESIMNAYRLHNGAPP